MNYMKNNLLYCYIILSISACFIIPVRGGVPFIVTSLAVPVLLYQYYREKQILFLYDNHIRVLYIIFIFILLWPVIGLCTSIPFRSKMISETWYTLCIISFLTFIIWNDYKTPSLTYQILKLLFILGCCCALASLILYVHDLFLSAEGFSLTGIKENRLVPFGRSQHQILGAGGLAAAFFAGYSLYSGKQNFLQKCVIYCGLFLLFTVICLTQSRGPVISLIAAVLGSFYIRFRNDKIRSILFITLICCALPALLVLSEPLIKSIICQGTDQGICRASLRADVWNEAVHHLLQSPFQGYGIGYRYTVNDVAHAHNTFIGIALTRGIPVALSFFLILVLALIRTVHIADSFIRKFVIVSLFFAVGFMATDLPNPFIVLNSHYFFLWLPIALGFCSKNRLS